MGKEVINRTILVGTHSDREYGACDVEIEIRVDEALEGPYLSITGSVWLPNRTEIVAGGQVTLSEWVDAYGLAPGITPALLEEIQDIWDQWHLNHMRPGCEHQRANWDTKRRVELDDGTTKPVGWLFIKEHPEGLLQRPCEECGYKYGTRWLYEPLPEEVIERLKTWPEITPLGERKEKVS